MIKTKTLLIVGAGASVPYGYPAGEGLMKKLYNPENLTELHHKIPSQEIELFCKDFKESQLNSIDAFLAKRGEDIIGKKSNGIHNSFVTYAECGKLAIAAELVKCEKMDKLFESDDHWLKYLWNLMSDVPKVEFHNNQLKIITFNYDRVIEQYLQTVIEKTYTDGNNSEEAFNLRKSIEIIHVYGNLQDLEDRPYGEKPSDLSKTANCIRVIPEAREDDEIFNQAKDIINWADKICFLGFGFDLTNMERLGFPNFDLVGKKIYSTHYGKTDSESLADRNLVATYLGKDGMSHYSWKTLQSMRERGFFLSL